MGVAYSLGQLDFAAAVLCRDLIREGQIDEALAILPEQIEAPEDVAT